MIAHVIAFSGGIKGGKSSVSQEVAARLGWPRISFGDHVRHVGSTRGLDASNRETLQTVGQELVDADVVDFSKAVLSRAGHNWMPGQNLIIDGLRHAEVAFALKDLIQPSVLKIVFIDADISARAARGHVQMADLARWDKHATESQLPTSIRDMADLIVDGAQPVEAIVHAVLLQLR